MTNESENLWDAEIPSEEEIEQRLKQQPKSRPTPQPQQQIQREAPVTQKQIQQVDDIFDLSEEDDKELLHNASLRLEQGQLYQLLMKHDLFEGVEADPRAIAKVQKELRSFIKEKLEIMLGLRPDPQVALPTHEFVGQFTEPEVTFLKKVVAKAMGNNPELKTLAPAQAEKPKVNSLKPISQPTIKKISQPEKTQAPKQQTQAPSKPVAQAPQAPAQKTAEEMSREEYLYSKPLSELTKGEIQERNELISKKQKNGFSFGGAGQKRPPMPNAQERMRLATLQAAARNKAPVGTNTNVGMVLNHMRSNGNLE